MSVFRKADRMLGAQGTMLTYDLKPGSDGRNSGLTVQSILHNKGYSRTKAQKGCIWLLVNSSWIPEVCHSQARGLCTDSSRDSND